MALGGDLRNINLADIFQTLSMNRQIGTLVIRNGVKEKRVYFSGTGVSLCSGRTIPGFRLGRYLVGTGKVTEEDLRIALEEQRRTGDLLGKALVDLELCTTDDVETVIRYHAAEELYEIFGWDRGEFQFLEGSSSDILDRPSPFALTQFDAGNIVMEAARRIDEWERVRETVPSDREIFVRSGVEGDELDTDEWGGDLAAVYGMVDGKIDTAEVLDRYHLSIFDTGMILRELVLNGLIRVCEFDELVDAAQRLIEEDDDETAAPILQRAHGIEPRDVTVLQLLTDCYERLGERRSAAATLLTLGEVHLAGEATADAIHALEKAEKYAPGNADAAVLLMRAYRTEGDLQSVADKARTAATLLNEKAEFDRSIPICREGLEAAPDQVSLKIVLANALLGAGQREPALAELEDVAACLEASRNYRKLEEVYRKILQLDSSRKEYLQRLQELKEGHVKRRKNMARYAIAVGGGVIVLVFSLFLLTSGTSAADRIAEARRLFGEKDYTGAYDMVIPLYDGDDNSDTGIAVRNLIAQIERAKDPATTVENTNERALVDTIDKWIVPASALLHDGKHREAFQQLRDLTGHLGSEEFAALAKKAGEKATERVLEECRKTVVSLLKDYTGALERRVEGGRNDLASLTQVKPNDRIEDIGPAVEVIGRVFERSDPREASWNVSAAEYVENQFETSNGKIQVRLRELYAELEKLHEDSGKRFHSLRSVLRRDELMTSFTETTRTMADLLNEGQLDVARKTCLDFLGKCETLRSETPLEAYEKVVTDLLGDGAIDLDGKMQKDLDVIDRVIEGISRGEDLIREGDYDGANREFRSLIRNNFRIDFSKLIGLVLHLETRPVDAEVRLTPQGQPTRLMGRITTDGMTIRYPPYGSTTVEIRKPTFERVEIRIRDFQDEKPSAQVVQLTKLPSWRHAGAGPMEARPVFHRGKVVVPGRDGHLRVFKASNGDVLLDHDTKLLNGFGAAPLVVGKNLVLASLDQRLLAIDIQSGRKSWERRIEKRVRSDPVLVGDMIVFVDETGTLTATLEGSKIWTRALDGRVPGDLCVADDAIFAGTTEGTLYRLHGATGEIAWSVALKGRISSTPVADGPGGRLYIGTDDSRLVAVSRKTGREEFSFTADNAVRGRAAVVADRVFFSTLGGTVYQVRTTDGVEVNRTALPDAVPVETGCVASGKKIYIVDTTGVLRSICPKGGVLWSFRLDGKVASPPLFFDGYLYVATEAGSVYCFKE